MSWHGVGYSLLALLGALFASALIAHPAGALTTVPTKMNFQGRLTDSSGAVVADGLYNMKFALYTVDTGGSSVWAETRETTNRVQVTNGLFATKLGDVSALSATIFASGSLYFEITLANPATATCSTASCQTWESPMTTRSLLSTSAYAYNAETLDGFDSAYFAPATGSASYAPISGSANYIQNGTGAQTASFNVTGTGTIGGAGTVTGNFTNNGASLFYNSTNSATAFTIQTSTAAKLFVADTTASRIYIGNPTPDAVGVVLVLDSSTAEPTGTNGAEYYNSTNNKLRCYQNGAWQDCITRNRVTLAANVTNNNATANTIADVTGLSFAVTSGRRTSFECLIWYTSAAATTGSRWTINGPTTTNLAYKSTYTIAATTVTTNFATAYNIPAASNTASLVAGNIAQISGTILPSASGNVIVRFASEISNSAIVAQAGSSCEYWNP